MSTPEIPPPPNTPRIMLESGRGRWRASIPSAVIVALITTVGTVAAQYVTSSQDVEEIKSRLDRIEARLDGRVPARLVSADP
jgi:hypothetical protein